MAIALATLETNLYTTFFNHLTSGTYSLITASTIANNAQVTPNYSDNISAQYGFPVIEIAQPTVSEIKTDRFGDVQRSMINMLFTIVEDNAADAKATTDSVKNMLLTGKQVFRAVGLSKIRIIDVGTNVVSKNKKHYHFKRFSFTCRYWERLA